jgi:glucans biosynthesis protein
LRIGPRLRKHRRRLERRRTANGPSQPFDFAWLKGQAHYLASNPYQNRRMCCRRAWRSSATININPSASEAIIRLWGDAGLAFRLQFFHVGRTFNQPVHLYEVVDGQAREIVYDPAMFEWDKSGIDPALMKDHAGFAGFRVQFVTNWRADVAAFLGASYFRAVGGDTRQYGLSARALAVDTAFPRPEEFPRFTSFWFERPAKDSGTLTLYALMDSPSIAGALRFQISRRHAHHEHRLGAVSAQADRALRHRPAHQHVLLWEKRSPRRQRLAAGDP